MDTPEKRKKSTEYFHTLPERLNCAQSILKGFQNELNISDEKIAEYKAWGGGRAENGVCGALFAARQLINNENGQFEKTFKEELGTIYCKELKKNKKACLTCVELADKLIEEAIKQK
jgi:hypothetical protein